MQFEMEVDWSISFTTKGLVAKRNGVILDCGCDVRYLTFKHNDNTHCQKCGGLR